MRRDLLWGPGGRHELVAYRPDYAEPVAGRWAAGREAPGATPRDAHSPARPPPVRTILVPVDGTPAGEHAIPVALGVARRTGARVQLVHVYSTLQAAGDPERLRVAGAAYPRAPFRAYLDDLAGRVAAAARVPVRPVFVESGWVDEALGRAAEDAGADLVVMAARARGWWDRVLRASVTAGVVRRVRAPVLLVPGKDEPPDLTRQVALDRVLIPLDTSDRAEAVLGPAAAIGPGSGGLYDLIHVARPAPVTAAWAVAYDGMVVIPTVVERAEAAQYLRSVARRLRARGVPARWEVVADDRPTAEAIARYAERTGADVIALTTRGRGPFARLFRGSVAEQVPRRASVPVLLHRTAL